VQICVRHALKELRYIMKCLNALSFVPVVLVALSTPAFAQDTPSGTDIPQHTLVGIGGAAFNHDFNNASASVAVEYGERVTRDIAAYANFSYLENLMSDKMQQNLTLAGSMLGQDFTGRDRGLTFTMGAKYLLPTQRIVRPYFGGGLGVANLKRTISEATFGDVSQTFFFMTGLNDGVIDAGKSATTRPLGELVAGVSAAFTNRAYVDIKYRYGHIFQTLENVDFSQVSFGAGFSF
jgi:opacity protein-like surface antigen